MNSQTTDWNKYRCRPKNFFYRKFFFDKMFAAYSELLKKAEFNEPISVLELGAGTGYINARLAAAIPIKKITVVDSNKKMIEISRQTLERVPCEKKFICRDFFGLELDEKFDLVHSGGVIEHFQGDQQIKLVKIHADYIKPGGYCIIYAPTPTFSYWLSRGLREGVHLWPFVDEVPIAKEDLKQLIQGAGLKILAGNYFWPHYLTEAGIIAKK